MAAAKTPVKSIHLAVVGTSVQMQWSLIGDVRSWGSHGQHEDMKLHSWYCVRSSSESLWVAVRVCIFAYKNISELLQHINTDAYTKLGQISAVLPCSSQLWSSGSLSSLTLTLTPLCCVSIIPPPRS